MDNELRAEVRAWKIEVDDRLAMLEAAILAMNAPIVVDDKTDAKTQKDAK